MSEQSSHAARADLASVLGNPDFRRVWAVGILTSMMRWLDFLVLGVFTFDLTDSAGQVAMVFLMRMLPRLLFGVLFGTMADRLNRKHLWVVSLIGLSAVSLALGLLIAGGDITYWHLLVAVFISGTLWATEFPVRRALMADLVPHEAIGRAVSIDWTTDSFNRMVGPAVGGGLLITVGADGAYLLIAAVFGLAALVATTLHYAPLKRDAEAKSNPLAHLVGGLRYARARRLLVGVLMVTILFNLVFAPYQSMIPVIGKDVLGADALRVGLLSAVEGLGAVLGALWIANRAQPEGYPRIYFYGTGLFFACALAFSQSETYILSGFLLFSAGFGFSAFAVMQTTILMRATSPAMRGRVLGVLSLAIGAGPVGALQVGPLVAGLGEQTTLTVLVLEGIVGLVLVGAFWPMLRRAWLDPLADVTRGDPEPTPD